MIRGDVLLVQLEHSLDLAIYHYVDDGDLFASYVFRVGKFLVDFQ